MQTVFHQIQGHTFQQRSQFAMLRSVDRNRVAPTEITVDFTLSALEAPGNLVAIVNTNDVTLEWEMPTDELDRVNRNLMGKTTQQNERSMQTEKQ